MILGRRAGAPVAAMPLFDLADLGRSSRLANEATIRGLCENAYLGEDRSLCRVLGRYKMFVDPNDTGLSSHLLLDGYWEMWLTEAIADLVRPGMRVIDVGANLGYFTLLMADLVGPSGRVDAFEPNPQLVERLRSSVAVNGLTARVQVHKTALADSEAAMRLVIPPNEPKNGHLVPWLDGDEDERLLTRRLDDYPHLADVEFIKIDADTSELAIWRGMRGLIERERPLTIVLEFAAKRYPDPGGFLDMICSDHFALAELTADEGVRPTTREQILASPGDEDIMLLLAR